MGKQPIYYVQKSNVQKSYRNEDGKTSTKYLETDRRSATADVTNPRPRDVGGTCRIQVLAAVRTQETAEGSNEAARSEFSRDGLPVGGTLVRRAHLSQQWCQV